MTISTISLTLRIREENLRLLLRTSNRLHSKGLSLPCPLLLACWYGAINRFAEREMPLGRRIQVEHFLSPTSPDHSAGVLLPIGNHSSFC